MSQLAIWALILGLLKLGGGIAAISKPKLIWDTLESFPRSVWPGRILSTIDLVWAALLVNAMPLGGFEHWKPALYVLCPLVVVAVPIYMDELLSPRALGGFYMLIAAPILDAGRWHPSGLSVIMAAIAYLMIVWGIILVLMPYQFNRVVGLTRGRDSAKVVVAWASVAIGTALICLGVFVY